MKKIGVLFLVLGIISLIVIGCSSSRPEMDLGDVELVWQDHEVATYDFLVDGEKRAQNVFTIEKDGENFKIDSFLEIDVGINATGAVVRGDDLQPVSAYYKNLPPPTSEAVSIEVTGQYEEGELAVEALQGEEGQELTVSLPGLVIDNESVLMAIRNFPLEEGYVKDINISIVSSAQVAPYTIKVEALETVQVPYGEVESYKVVMEYTGQGSVPDMYAWYSNDADRIMVKYQNRNVLFELNDLDTEGI